MNGQGKRGGVSSALARRQTIKDSGVIASGCYNKLKAHVIKSF